jgi:GT2 family glycosyltransferase
MSADRPSSPTPFVLAATWVCADVLILAGTFPSARRTRSVSVLAGSRWVRIPGVKLLAGQGSVPGVMTVSVRGLQVSPANVSAIRIAGTTIELDSLLVDLARLLRCGFASGSVVERARALEFLVQSTLGQLLVVPADLAATLGLARTILREPRPGVDIDCTLPPGAGIELIVRVDPCTVYIRGWIGHVASQLVRVTLVSPEGQRAEVPPTAFRYTIRHVLDFYGLDNERCDEWGLASLCEFESPTGPTNGWILEIETADDTFVELTCPQLVDDVLPARDLLIAELALERPPSQALRARHLMPAITRLQERLTRAIKVARVEQFGVAPRHPEVTIVVPLYQRLDFIEHQMVQFALDPELAGTDLVYVLDSPEQERELLAQAERLARLYPVPFRVAVLSANGGFSTANNLGMTLARGRLAVLMNSDVVPDQPGWLSALVAFHDGLDNPGVVAPKLVYEDDSLQHAGMYFERPPGARLWYNEHYYKGMHRSFAPACVSRTVPAVSAACLIIRTALYRKVSGLRGVFIQGDFEDSDLCLRLRDLGCENWYAAGVSLYHLEGQSYPNAKRHANGEFNRWLHTHLWDSRIETIMANESTVKV